MALIEMDDVVKDFVRHTRRGVVRRSRTRVVAVDHLTLSIERGELCGCIGPNGAGKSTTIKMLTGILVPSSGSVRVAGVDPQRRRIELVRKIGVVFGQRTQLWWDLPLRDSFDLLRHIYRVPSEQHRERLERFTALLELGPFLDTPVRQLSLGQRMRGELTAALLHDPEVLYLDEPTIGLDLVSKERIREFILDLNRRAGVTVLLTTHDLADVERLCSRLIVLDGGRLVQDDTVAAVRERFGGYRTLIVDLESPQPPLVAPHVTVVRTEGPRQWLRFRPDETSAAEVITAVVATARVRDLAIEEPAIEDVVRTIYATGRDGSPRGGSPISGAQPLVREW